MKPSRHFAATKVRRILILMGLDILSILGSYFFALLLRFDFLYSRIVAYSPEFIDNYLKLMPWVCLVTLVVFFCCRLYHGIWRLAGVAEMENIFIAFILLLPCYMVLLLLTKFTLPRGVYVIGYLISFCCCTGIRFSFRMIRYFTGSIVRYTRKNADRVMVIGAGEAGQMIIREMQNSDKLVTYVCCVIDDNPNKLGKTIGGVPVVGNRHSIVAMAQKYKVTRIVVAIPTLDPVERRAILNICKETHCRLQTLPGMFQLINGEVGLGQIRDVEVTDLLGREQVVVNNREIFQDLDGKVVLVTGGGGSIGSELCRQIARANPKQLIIFDIYENNAYAIEQELLRLMPELNLLTLIGSVRNTSRIRSVMESCRPDIVFHAAAHKHVPLMENSPNEAIKNNVLGTFKTAQAAADFGVKKFVLISTDKAVNPTNIMGASKRICEMVVQMMDRRCSDTSFVAVRFGNVLGSNGSVIPLFKKQIAEGGPVTVTDKRIIRYFMTIPEAVSLVLQASYYARGGEIFVLDMGEPVHIDDMARNLIRLSGFTPDVDIKIVYTGLRPGEKLYEELLMDEEGMTDTANRMIHIGRPIEMDDRWFLDKLRELEKACTHESPRIRQLVSEIVPTYRCAEEEGQTAAGVK